MLAGTKVYFTFGTGSDTYDGEAFIESIEVNAPSDDKVSYSVSLKGTGALTKAK